MGSPKHDPYVTYVNETCFFFVVFYPSFKIFSGGGEEAELMPEMPNSLWSTWRDSRWLEVKYTIYFTETWNPWVSTWNNMLFLSKESKDYLCSVGLLKYRYKCKYKFKFRYIYIYSRLLTCPQQLESPISISHNMFLIWQWQHCNVLRNSLDLFCLRWVGNFQLFLCWVGLWGADAYKMKRLGLAKDLKCHGEEAPTTSSRTQQKENMKVYSLYWSLRTG